MKRVLFPKLVAGLALMLAGACAPMYRPAGGPAPGATSTSQGSGQEAEGESAGKDGSGGQDSGEKNGDKKDEKPPFEPWEKAIKDTEPIEGFFTFHRKRDGALLLEIPLDRLESEFGLVLHLSRGVGDFNVQQGLPLSGTQLMKLRRVADRVHLVRLNPRFVADDSSAFDLALQANVGHSVMAALKLKSEHPESKALLVDATEFLLSDYANLSRWLSGYYGRKPVSLAKNRSYVGRVQGFPRNVEIDAELTFTASDPPQASGGYGVADTRSIPVGVRFSIFALPETRMAPRFADDRVGHFLTARWDFSHDREMVPYLRYVNRWRLEKRDPAAEMSEAVTPIVFYVDRSVPAEYRQYVKEGIEAWNKAFEAAGYRNAIVAKDPPDDENWSAEDLRYSTVRWTPSYNMGYAIGPSQTDPRTGEILNADVLIWDGIIRGWLLQYENIGPAAGRGLVQGHLGVLGSGSPSDSPTRDLAESTPLGRLISQYRDGVVLRESLPPELASRVCLAAIGKVQQAAFARTVLLALGEETAGEGLPDGYVGDAIRDLVMHEIGHTLGLRHNFKSSSGVPHEQLNDTAFTRRNGLTLSVMDYAPVNISPDRDRQGHYWNQEVGSYDVWAIRYAYEPMYEKYETTSAGGAPEATPGTSRSTLADAGGDMRTAGSAVAPSGTARQPIMDPEQEVEALRRIAALGADPLHTYGTDEDNWLGSFAIDPNTNAWDLGSDPLAYARDRASIVAKVQPQLEKRLIEEGEGYQRLRSAMISLIFERYLSLLPITKTVGGIEFARDHKGDPSGRPPFTPVSGDRQRQAVEFLVEQAFSAGSFPFDPELLNKLAPNRFNHWGMGIQLPVDFPAHSYVSLIQQVLLGELLAPPRLWRLIDNETRMAQGDRPYRVSDLFSNLTDAIWSELGEEGQPARSPDSFRRNLQRAHIRRLSSLLLNDGGSGPVAAPEDARSLARQELKQLSARMGTLLAGSGLNAMTRAHLAESKARVDRVLEASLVEGQLRLRR
jgi:hypothetical protein